MTMANLNRAFDLMLVLMVGLLAQGCVAFPYDDTPAVSGNIVDAVTGKPVIGAKVGFRGHERVDTWTGIRRQLSRPRYLHVETMLYFAGGAWANERGIFRGGSGI
jgi:hypothetical protein